jgi:hypothetical protein
VLETVTGVFPPPPGTSTEKNYHQAGRLSFTLSSFFHSQQIPFQIGFWLGNNVVYP